MEDERMRKVLGDCTGIGHNIEFTIFQDLVSTHKVF